MNAWKFADHKLHSVIFKSNGDWLIHASNSSRLMAADVLLYLSRRRCTLYGWRSNQGSEVNLRQVAEYSRNMPRWAMNCCDKALTTTYHICLGSWINSCLNKHSLKAWYYEVGVFTTTGSHKYHCKFPTASFYRFKGYSQAEFILNQPVPRSSSRTKRGHLVLNNPWRGYWPDEAGYLSTFLQTWVLLMHW